MPRFERGLVYAIPQSVKDIEYDPEYLSLMHRIEAVYGEMLALGVPPEDARFVLPNASETKLVMTMNARELRHFFAQRLCEKAQWEIRELATEIYLQCKAKEPVLFADAGPDCKNCQEKDPCR